MHMAGYQHFPFLLQMAEGIAYELAEKLITKVASSAFQEIISLYGVRGELRKLIKTLSTIKAVLADAYKQRERSDTLKDWIKRLEQVVYDADDLLDEFAYEDLRRMSDTRGRLARQVGDFLSSSNHVVFRLKMLHGIQKIRGRLDEIANDISKFNLRNIVIANTPFRSGERETHSFVPTSDIIGRDKEKEEMIKMLMVSDSAESVSVIPIVGLGGLGKTALAKLVFNDKRVTNQFNPKIWVCVSEDFNIKLIVRNILNSINERVEDLTMEQLQIRLRKKLDGKRYLLVLDDVWNEESGRWIELKQLLMDGANGSKIMITTRSNRVASAMGIYSPYDLKGLTDDQSWELFVKLAFRHGLENVPENVIKIGKDLIQRCKGVPLAIKTLGSTMRNTSESEWLSIQNNEIWSLSPDDGGILSVLKLSYDQLPTELKHCFAYCSMFPKDYKIEYEVLIQLWMAQGYIQPYGCNNLEQISDMYFKFLVSISFFQEVQLDDFGNITTFKMHDLIHDLAVSVAGTETVEEAERRFITNSGAERMLVQRHLEGLSRRLRKEKGVRTFFLTVDHGWRLGYFSQSTILSKFRCLRVLDLNNCGLEYVQSSIGQLKHLRFLDLSKNVKITGLPKEICNLLYLQTLKLSDCESLKKLPRDLTKLVSLRYLMTNGCTQLTHMPSGLGKFTSLQRLPMFVVGRDQRNYGSLVELKGLNDLRGEILIKNLENVGVDVVSESRGANLKEKPHLQSLIFEWEETRTTSNSAELVLEGLQPHPNLEALGIYKYCGARFPSWMIEMECIVKITISSCNRCQQLQPLDRLPHLKFLSLEELVEMEYIQDFDHNNGPTSFFPSLQEVKLRDLTKLKGWWRREVSTIDEDEESILLSRPSFPMLAKLFIEDCPMLTSMPLHPHLEELDVFNVSKKLLRQQLLTAEVLAKISSSPSPLPPPPPLPLPLLPLLLLPLLPPFLLRLLLLLLLLLLPLPSPASSSKLTSLQIWRIEDLECLPRECLQHLSSLETLIIHGCKRLVYLTGYGEHFRWLTSLRSLEIVNCEKLTSLSRGFQHLTALEYLKIRKCPELDLTDIGEDCMDWKGLKSLRRFEIERVPKLVSLPAGVQFLTTLQYLRIDLCSGLSAVPEWMGDLTLLQRLEFRECRELTSLPQGMSSLTSLQVLKINYCPGLTERCKNEIGEDWPKIAHIPNIIIDREIIQGRHLI